jgi:GNAT superfamily N-acetyltransferase
MAASYIDESGGGKFNMTKSAEPSTQFAVDFAARRAGFRLRTEDKADQPFLFALFTACSPLGASLPKPMIEQQARFQNQAYRDNYPNASRWIIMRGERSIGRIIIDWGIDGNSRCIDLAIIPEEQGEGIGTALLCVWIAVSERLDRDCCLQVVADSRAKDLYVRLGFVVTGDPHQPSIAMTRPVGDHDHSENA